MTTKHVLVTGGTNGIGAACVRQLAADGYGVIFCGRDAAAGQDLQAEVAGSTFIKADLSDPQELRQLADRASKLGGGRLSGLVNNAGRSARVRFADTDESLCDSVLSLNLKAPILLTAYCLPALREGRGSVVMMSSIAGKTGEQGIALYTASKAGLIGLTKALALELGPEIRVNAVCPGQIETQMMAKTLAIPGRREMIQGRIPAARMGQPQDVAEAVAWLISAKSSFVTGDIMTVDGGETAGLLNLPSSDAS